MSIEHELNAVADFCKEYGFRYALSVVETEPRPRSSCGTCRWFYYLSGNLDTVGYCRFNPPTNQGFGLTQAGCVCSQHSPVGIEYQLEKLGNYYADAVSQCYGFRSHGEFVQVRDQLGNGTEK